MANRKLYSRGVLTYEDVNNALDEILFDIIEAYDSNEYDSVAWGIYHHYWNGGFYVSENAEDAKYILESLKEYLERHLDVRGINKYIDAVEGLLYSI
jgi:hypothetical protein